MKAITMRNYRTYLINLGQETTNATLIEKAKKVDTKELKVWFTCEFMLNAGKMPYTN